MHARRAAGACSLAHGARTPHDCGGAALELYPAISVSRTHNVVGVISVITEHLLHARHCSRLWGYRGGKNYLCPAL